MATLPPGVPALAANLAALFTTPALLTGDSIAAIIGFGAPMWGIYDQNNDPVVIADSVVSFDYKQHWKIADYPIEQGDFSTYDKVTLPYDARFVFSQGGSQSDRAAFLSSIETVAASFDLYNVVTPEITYLDANIEMLSYRRTAENGVGLLQVEIGLRQVRQTAAQTFAQTAAPSGADQVNGGTVQPTAATPTQQSAISDFFGG